MPHARRLVLALRRPRALFAVAGTRDISSSCERRQHQDASSTNASPYNASLSPRIQCSTAALPGPRGAPTIVPVDALGAGAPAVAVAGVRHDSSTYGEPETLFHGELSHV